ncbi:hypothetical protein BJY01DRAFT_73995 [Aspergillus pseudoustus]|uniref:Protein BNI4 n=1 Tax=Aspergillus pseudoustus TaxID=1810923 RepID=A0ABR4KM58_9EURO
MAALVQTIPQQSSAVPVLQTRPSSSSGAFTTSQSLQQTNSRNSAMSWNTYNTTASNSGGYRQGHQVVAPYAFTTTPNLSNSPNNSQNRQSWSPSLRPEHRTSSAPSAPQIPANAAPVGISSRPAHHTAAGSVSTSSSNSSVQSYISKDDTAIPSPRQLRGDPPIRPLSTANLPSPTPPFMNISSPTVSRPSPDRYRRGNRRSDSPAGTPTAIPGSARTSPAILDENSQQPTIPGSLGIRSLVPDNNSHNVGHTRAPSADDVARSDKPQPELAKRYRRRSWGNIDNTGLINLQLHLPVSSPIPMPKGQDYFDQDRPRSAQSHKEVSGSIHSARSSTSSVHDPSVPNKPVTKPDDTKRTPKPSPLSQPVSADPTSPETTQPNSPQNQPKPMSPASQRLAELTKNDTHRPGKSRLRRAFSFGSASELLKASQNNHRKDGHLVDKSRRDLLKEELGAEQAAIAEQQEASGLGESIYSHHQGRFFNSSTDNLSISSTASSASIMLRKMGKGMKRSTRSLVGLFRPKSAVISSVDEITAEPMAPQLSVVNIEAERKSVAANADPQDVPHGGTVFPKMESTVPPVSSQDDDSTEAATQSRKSIVGGDRERAEVLAAVRKGILKKTNSDIALSTPAKPASQNENSTDSPNSSAPSTPDDQPRTGYRRSEAVKIAGEDDLSETKNVSLGPQPVSSKSLVFSPRIQFHETWPSGEYDRRGDIATCNRLTPLLAQQIKEELNSFKMVSFEDLQVFLAYKH